MASAARSFTRVALRSSALKTSTTRATLPVLSQSFRQQSHRHYSDIKTPPKPQGTENEPPIGKKLLFQSLGVLLVAGVGYGTYHYFTENPFNAKDSKEPKIFTPKFEDYQEVYDAIAKQLVEQDDYDDGSYGPVLLRLAWHCSGTFDKTTGTGGSNGATMRFAPESSHSANSGLQAARAFLEPLKSQFPWISYGDLWTLAGVCAVQEMQGPIVPWRPGRQDRDVAYCTPDGRLPDGSRTQDHLRDVFYRMGFDDREIVALSGAHALGRCHKERSGYEGPWTFSPTTVTNEFFKLLVEEKWRWRRWDGPKQFEDVKTKTLMLLPSDMALVQDPVFKEHVEKYAADSDVFFNDFSAVLVKLFELGVPFTSSKEDRFRFKPSE